MSEYDEMFLSKILNGNSLEDSPGIPELCEICENYLSGPILLPCLHFFDKNCIIGLENDLLDYNQIKCPKCDFTAILSNSQPLNVNLFNVKLDSKYKDDELDDNDNKCILCTNDEIGVYKCSDCAGIICERCRILHKEVVVFQAHNNVQELTQKDKDNIKDVVKFLGDNKPVKCQIHKETNIDSFCFKCFGHCVCVYKQDGTFLFRFGNEKITNYPNGIDVSNHGDILVGDSHGNRFHVAVFTKDDHLTGEFECSSVKVSRACGLKITSEGYLVTLAKNNHNVLVIDTLYVN